MSAAGFFAIGVWHPKKTVNVGSLMRTAHAYGAAFTFCIGAPRDAIYQKSNTSKSWLEVPHYEYDDLAGLRANLPIKCWLVGVEQAPEAKQLRPYQHPMQAAYICGAEGGGLPKDVLSQCDQVIEIEGGRWCLNVAVAGSIVVYDRWRKQPHAVPEGPTT